MLLQLFFLPSFLPSFQAPHRGARPPHPGRVPLQAGPGGQEPLQAGLDGGQLHPHRGVQAALQADQAVPPGEREREKKDHLCVYKNYILVSMYVLVLRHDKMSVFVLKKKLRPEFQVEKKAEKKICQKKKEIDLGSTLCTTTYYLY